METSKFRAIVKKNDTLEIPKHVLERIYEDVECVIVIRPVRASKKGNLSVEKVINDIERQMANVFPNLRKQISKEIRNVAGISDDISEKYSNYSDKELIGMARMEKYLEKGEIIESLY